MKTKKLLLFVLALAIITSLTAGTLAVYTKTVTMTGKVEAKKFAFTATGKIENNAEKINLAPTESQSYLFTVTNQDGKVTAEVPLNYNIAIGFADAATQMPGLTATLYQKNGGEEDEAYKEVKTGTGTIAYSQSTEANQATEHDYKLTLTWAGSDNAGQTTAGAKKATFEQGLNITVAAVQATNN